MYSYIEDYIYKLYTSIGIKYPIELDMDLIATRIGVEIVYKDNPYSFNNEIILEKASKSEEWMDFGHEICHYLRHCGSQLNMHPLFIELQEYQANYFAYHFCVPTFMLEQIRLPFCRYRAKAIICESFNVDIAFARRRLEIYQNSILSKV